MKKYLIVAMVALIAACSPSSTDTYETTSKSRWKTKTIEVHFMNQRDVDDKCRQIGGGQEPKYGACARTKPEDHSICEIYTAEPLNFDDSPRLETLGHEAWHCFGATHK